jgi:single-strand DNA-binding protein
MNSVNLMGRLTRDPELKDTGSVKVINFSVGFNDPFNKDKSNFIDCVAFGKTAETIGEYLHKGDPIYMTGRLQQDKWKDKSGDNRSKIVMNVERFSFAPKSSGSGGTNANERRDTEVAEPQMDVPF